MLCAIHVIVVIFSPCFPPFRYATDTAARIGDLLARKAAEAHAKKHRTPPVRALFAIVQALLE